MEIIAELGAGSYFGELSLLKPTISKTNIIASVNISYL